MNYNYQGQPGMSFPGQNPPQHPYPGESQMPMPFPGQNPSTPSYPGLNQMPMPFSGQNPSYPGQNQASMPMPGQYSSMPTGGMPTPSPSYPNQQSPYPQQGSGNPSYPRQPPAPYPQSYQPYPQMNQAHLPSMTHPKQQVLSPHPAMGSAPSSNFQSCGAQPPPYSGGHHQVTSMTHTSYSTHQSAPGHMQTSVKTKLSPTVFHQANFDATKDAEALRKAMKGFGTDEKSIIKILANRSNMQRQAIAMQFQTLYRKDLISDLKSELSGNFENLIVAMMTPLMAFYAMELFNAISGLGTDECVLIEILCTLSNQEIRSVQEAYLTIYGKTLQDHLRHDTSGHFRRLMISLCCANRDESCHVDKNSAVTDAKKLYEAGVKKFGTDESTFNTILVQRSIPQLQLIFKEYEKISRHSIAKAIKKEFSGDIERGFLTIVKCVHDPAKYFAKQLMKSMKGMGTHDRHLIRIVVTRSEIDMGDIKKAYKKKYGKSLEDAISSDCSGDYKKCLVDLIS